MGCLYCGCKVTGMRRKFCSDKCCKNYFELLRQREIKGHKVPLAHCKNCGRILKYNQRDYCSTECRYNAMKLPVLDGCNALRAAILRQAVKDRALGKWSQTEEFGKLFPEISPNWVERIAKEMKA